MSRLIKADRYYMRLAFQIAQGSKCVRAQYGSVIVAADGKRIVATGYNGKPAGSCNDGVCYRMNAQPNDRNVRPCCLHSERNALMFSNPLDRQGGTLYVSGRPCAECALAIMQSGIRRLVWYAGDTAHGHAGDSNDDLWTSYGVPIERVAYTDEAWEALHG